MIRASRLFALALGVIAFGMLAGGTGRAAAPELVATVGHGFSQLVIDGTRIWAAQLGVVGRVRLVVENGEAVAADEIVLPAETVRIAAAPDGILYAVTVEHKASVARVWEKAGEAAWREVTSVAWEPMHLVRGVSMIWIDGRLVISVARDASIFADPGDEFGEAFLLLVDPATEASQRVDQDVRGFVRDGGVLYATRHTKMPGGLLVEAVKSLDRGETWTALPAAGQPVNSPTPPLVLGGPATAEEGRLFWYDGLSHAVLFTREGGVPVAYALPEDSRGAFYGMRVARGGESWVAVFEQPSEWPGMPSRVWALTSSRFLRDIESHEINHFSLSDAVVGPDGFYLLHNSPAGGSVLLRVPLPETRLPVLATPQLSASAGVRTFVDPITRNPSERAVIEITIPGGGNVFHQLETSSDLETWQPLGLPVPAGAVEAVVSEPSVSRRFFR
jgi:hypothetical protein